MFDKQSVLGVDPFDDPEVIKSLTEAERKATMPDEAWQAAQEDVLEMPVHDVYTPQERAARAAAAKTQMSATGKAKPIPTAVKVGLGLLALGGAYYLWKNRS